MEIPDRWIIPINDSTRELIIKYRELKNFSTTEFWLDKGTYFIMTNRGYIIGDINKHAYSEQFNYPTITKEQLSYILGIKLLTMKDKLKLLKI